MSCFPLHIPGTEGDAFYRLSDLTPLRVRQGQEGIHSNFSGAMRAPQGFTEGPHAGLPGAAR